jgi:hypothetical protein
MCYGIDQLLFFGRRRGKQFPREEKESSMQPALFERLNEKNCVDTRWIAEASGKSLKHVHDHLNRLFPKMVHKMDHQADSRGYAICYWLPLAEALYMMSTYQGERAEKARALVMEAIDFYVFEAPRLRAENASLKSNTKNVRALPKVSTVPFTTSVTRTKNLFGEDIFTRIRTKIAESALTPIEIMKAKRANLVLAAEGMLRKIERMDSEIEFFEQPAAQRLQLVEKK